MSFYSTILTELQKVSGLVSNPRTQKRITKAIDTPNPIGALKLRNSWNVRQAFLNKETPGFYRNAMDEIYKGPRASKKSIDLRRGSGNTQKIKAVADIIRKNRKTL